MPQEQGKTIDDLAVVAAYNASGVNIQGFRVAGGDAAMLEDVILDQLKDTGVLASRAKPEPAEVAGKAVSRITTAAGDGYLYPRHDVYWVVQAPNDSVRTEVFAALP